MTDLRFRRLERRRMGGARDRMALAYPIPRSPSGKVYQLSPSPHAVPRLFLIGDAPKERMVAERHRSRIRRVPGPGQTVCPYTGHVADDAEFVHSADIETAHKQVLYEAAADMSDYLGELARDFNRKQPRDGFVTIRMEHKPSRLSPPAAIREDLLRDLVCEICARAYSVYAIALFCPDCGAPNLTLHYRREVALVHEQLTLATSQDSAGRHELAYRLMGNAHEDVLTAFETTLKTVYRYLIRERLPERAETLCRKKAIGNAFQSVARGREKFASLRINPFEVLSDQERVRVTLNFEKRHVIGHNLGIADEHYVALTQKDQLGATVQLIGKEIGGFADSCLTVINQLEVALLPESEPEPPRM